MLPRLPRRASLVAIATSLAVAVIPLSGFTRPCDKAYDFVASWGTVGHGPGQFEQPVYLAIDGEVLIVADTNNGRLQRFRIAGARDSSYIDSMPVGIEAWGVAVDRQRRIYAADRAGNRIVRFLPTGAPDPSWGLTGGRPGDVHKPMGLAVDPQGSVFVTEYDDGNVRVFRDGVWQLFASSLIHPSGIATDDRKVYVSDTGRDRVLSYNLHGSAAPEVMEDASQNLSNPIGIAVDRRGNVFVACGAGTYSVHRIRLTDHCVTIIGAPLNAGGPFVGPEGLAVHASGRLYVSEWNTDGPPEGWVSRVDCFAPRAKDDRHGGGGDPDHDDK